MDFHAFGRVGYTNLVLDSGARVKEAMDLARNSTRDLTLNTYSRARDKRLREITEKVGEMVKWGVGNPPLTARPSNQIF